MSSIASSSSRTPPEPSLRDRVKPPVLQGMTTLDRFAFDQTYKIMALKVDPARISALRSHPLLRGQILDIPKIAPIAADPDDPSVRLLRLRAASQEQLPEGVRDLLLREGEGFRPSSIDVGYDYWNASDILHSILPKSAEEAIPSSFTQTGHIGHVNLRDEWLPYKNLIGQVFLDKNPKLRTIVNKLNTIHAEYRYFDMEVIAGDQDFITTLSESNCTFTFDFSKVYWNSRLSHEHDRLVHLLSPESVIADVMAGVGPFAIPAAKKGCFALGNDLNPESVEWMGVNRSKNKVESTLRVSGMDGREFIRNSNEMVWNDPFPPWTPAVGTRQLEREARERRRQRAAEPKPESSQTSSLPHPSSLVTTPNTTASPSIPAKAQPESKGRTQLVQHYIMNLPDSAITFLNAFIGLLTPLFSDPLFTSMSKEGKVEMPMIHVYCFTRFTERDAAQLDICQRASDTLQHPVEPDMQGYHLHLVRSVAPNKDMYCLSFRLPEEVALAPRPA